MTKYLQESSTDLGGYLWLLADVVLSPPTKPEITLQALIDDVNSRPLHSLPKVTSNHSSIGNSWYKFMLSLSVLVPGRAFWVRMIFSITISSQ